MRLIKELFDAGYEDAKKEYTLYSKIAFIRGISPYANGWNKRMQEIKDAQDVSVE